MYQKTQKRFPIARCANPSCGCTILYGSDPKEKINVTVRIADENYQGPTILCAKCKTMLAVIEKPKVATGFVAVPVVAMVDL